MSPECVLQRGRPWPLWDDVSFGYVVLPVYLREDLEKVGSVCKLVKAGIFDRSLSKSGARGLIADRCWLLTLLKLEKSL